MQVCSAGIQAIQHSIELLDLLSLTVEHICSEIHGMPSWKCVKNELGFLSEFTFTPVTSVPSLLPPQSPCPFVFHDCNSTVRGHQCTVSLSPKDQVWCQIVMLT